MSSFANLKRSSSNLETLAQKIQEQTTSNDSNNDDSNYWRPEVDKAGNGYAVIRFLPTPASDGDDGLPWAKIYTHGFQGPGGWYIENSLTSLNEKDPVSEYNSELWNSGIEANKEIARKQKRRLTYVSNIYIVEDPKHPENNGRVFLFKYGKKIHEKIVGAMNPEFADEQAINPFDFWAGANFKLKIRKVEGYQNYDKSEFDSVSPLLGGDDAKLEKIWQSEFSLTEILDRKHFKSYDELKTRLSKVLGSAPVPKNTQFAEPKPAMKQTTVEDVPEISNEKLDLPFDEDDSSLDYFNSLANDE
jgi:hypothetical protein